MNVIIYLYEFELRMVTSTAAKGHVTYSGHLYHEWKEQEKISRIATVSLLNLKPGDGLKLGNI